MNPAKNKPYMEAGFACAIAATSSGWVVTQIAHTPEALNARGHVQYLPEGGFEPAVFSPNELVSRVVVHLTGLVAQEKHEGECIRCGHSLDSVRAIVERMVMEFGLSRLSGVKQVSRDDIEAECNRIISECEVLAHRVVEADAERIEALVEALLREGVLEQPEIDRLFAAYPSKVTPEMVSFDPTG